jgi:homoserine kinase
MIRVSAPASAANLGPGFDVLALALDLRLSVEAEPSQGWEVIGAQDEATLRVVSSLDVPPMRLTIDSDVPVGRGLGSSAALRTAIAAAALAVGGEIDRDEVFRRVAAAEGHPDNAAAAVHGGLVAVSPGGVAVRLAVHPSLLVVVGVPAYPIATERAREALPAEVGRADAVGTAARLAFLVEGLRSAEPGTLTAATGDEVHERVRAPLSPVTGDLIRAARSAGALHAAWSGAGPAAIAFSTEHDVDAVAGAMAEVLQGDGEVLEPEIDRLGIVIEP